MRQYMDDCYQAAVAQARTDAQVATENAVATYRARLATAESAVDRASARLWLYQTRYAIAERLRAVEAPASALYLEALAGITAAHNADRPARR